MSTISDVQQLLNTTSNPGAGRGELVAQEQFLKLMVAQMENQDPMQPMENGEFLTQIAQFSTASGVGELQASFEAMVTSLQRNQMGNATSMLGRDVLYQTDSANLAQDGPIDGQLLLPSYASSVVLQIQDSNGAAVANVSLGSRNGGTSNFTWDGLTSAGVRAVPGEYSIVANATIDGLPRSIPIQMYGRVESVAVDPASGQVDLQLLNGDRLALSDVYEFK